MTRRTSNFGAARYIAEKYGSGIQDDKIIEIAKALKLKGKILLKNYKSICAINDIMDNLKSVTKND